MSSRIRDIPVVPALDAPHPLDSEASGCAENEPYALRVIGDAMAPEFLDGHIIIVEPALSARSGQFVVADYEGETWFRQYVVQADGVRLLVALNAAHPPITVSAPGGFRVRGVVVQRAGRRRREHKSYY